MSLCHPRLLRYSTRINTSSKTGPPGCECLVHPSWSSTFGFSAPEYVLLSIIMAPTVLANCYLAKISLRDLQCQEDFFRFGLPACRRQVRRQAPALGQAAPSETGFRRNDSKPESCYSRVLFVGNPECFDS
jgi:hypothetical protein